MCIRDSRYVDVQICEACGMDEALRDAVHIPLSLEEWDAIKQGRLLRPQKSRDCYLKTTCGFDQVFQHTYTPPMQATKRPVSEVAYSLSLIHIFPIHGLTLYRRRPSWCE